jgi:hypothetical protein
MSTTIASYLPDSQLIKLGSDFAAFTDPSQPRGFVGPHEIAYIFHEWAHYLHNVSTIHGLSSFANLVHLWTEFRRTIGPDGLSRGSACLDEAEQLSIHQKLTFMAAVRRPRLIDLPSGIRLNQVRVSSVTFRDHAIPGLTVTTRTIISVLSVSNESGDEFLCSVEIGAHEIIESVAYMLEERLTIKLKAIPAEPAFAPYFLLRILASRLAPSLDDQSILLCGLASLQDSDPASSIIEILQFAHRERSRGSEILPVIAERQATVIAHAQEWIDERLREVESVFPLDEPMARAVRSTTRTIRANFEFRKRSPFFELSLIDRIAASPNSLNEILKEHGACAIMQQRPGSEDDIQRDLIYEFVLQGDCDEDLHHGRRVMHAAFRFTTLHSTNKGISATSQLRPSHVTKCPFYTVCDLEPRQASSEVCAERPWLTALPETPSVCWYGQAIKKIGPPRDEGITRIT